MLKEPLTVVGPDGGFVITDEAFNLPDFRSPINFYQRIIPNLFNKIGKVAPRIQTLKGVVQPAVIAPQLVFFFHDAGGISLLRQGERRRYPRKTAADDQRRMVDA